MKKREPADRRNHPSQFFGTHLRKIAVGDFTCSLSRASVPKDELREHAHKDGHIILAIDPGYLSRAFSRDEEGGGFDLIYNPTGTVHRDCFVRTGGRFLSIAFPGDIAPEAAAPARVVNDEARMAADRVLGLCASNAPERELQLEEGLLVLLAAVAGSRKADLPPPWLRSAKDLIETRATEQGVTISRLAEELGLHPVYFARAFRKAFGIGPSRAIQQHRVRAAAAMLNRDRRLSDIALDSGFADHSHMSRSLNAFLGITPTTLSAAFSCNQVANLQDAAAVSPY